MSDDLKKLGEFEADASESSDEAAEVAAIEKDELENHADFVVSDDTVEGEDSHPSDEDYVTDETVEMAGVDELCAACQKKLCKECKQLLQ